MFCLVSKKQLDALIEYCRAQQVASEDCIRDKERDRVSDWTVGFAWGSRQGYEDLYHILKALKDQSPEFAVADPTTPDKTKS